MSSSGPGARTGGDRETCRYCPGSKALVPHVYGVLSVLLPYRICQRSLVTLCLDCRVSPATFGSLFTGLSAKMTYYKAYIVLESYTLQKALSDACAQVPSPVYSHTISRGTAHHSRHKSDIQGGHTGHHTHAGDALWTQVHSDSARGRRQSARLIRFSSLKAVSATCERREQTKKRNRKRAEVVALCWRTGVGYILAQYALSHRQLCKNSSFELHAPARRSAAQRQGRCCWRHLSARSGCDRRPYPEGT